MIPELPSGFPDPLLVGKLRNRRNRTRANILDVPQEIRFRIYSFLPKQTSLYVSMNHYGQRFMMTIHPSANLMRTCKTLRAEVHSFAGQGRAGSQNCRPLDKVVREPDTQGLLLSITALNLTLRAATRGQGFVRYLDHFANLEAVRIMLVTDDLPEAWWTTTSDAERLKVFTTLSAAYQNWSYVRRKDSQPGAEIVVPVGRYVQSGGVRKVEYLEVSPDVRLCMHALMYVQYIYLVFQGNSYVVVHRTVLSPSTRVPASV